MKLPTTSQGRPFGSESLAQAQALLHDHAQWSRYRLNRELALRWHWRTAQGQLKDMAARTLLLKLEVLGWGAGQRTRRLGGIVNHARFLILPWVRVPHLASHVLGLDSRRLRQAWATKYAQPLWLVETFVTRNASPAPATAPPTGCTWARPKAGAAKAPVPTCCPRRSRTSMSGPCTETFAAI